MFRSSRYPTARVKSCTNMKRSLHTGKTPGLGSLYNPEKARTSYFHSPKARSMRCFSLRTSILLIFNHQIHEEILIFLTATIALRVFLYLLVAAFKATSLRASEKSYNKIY